MTNFLEGLEFKADDFDCWKIYAAAQEYRYTPIDDQSRVTKNFHRILEEVSIIANRLLLERLEARAKHLGEALQKLVTPS